MAMMAAAQIVAADPVAVSLQLGGYRAVIGSAHACREAALALRAMAFRNGKTDADRFDDDCQHGCVTTTTGTAKVAFRVRVFDDSATLSGSYTGQHYDLSSLRAMQGPYLELGRFCQSEGPVDTAAVRLAWAALGVLVDRACVGLMFGCSSFPGADPERHCAELALLWTRHLGPEALRPRRLSVNAVDLPSSAVNNANLPPLLRSYLGMGGWVSDHAVRDPDLDRLHVFTGLAIDAIPEPRKARLRALAQAAQSTPLDLAPAAP